MTKNERGRSNSSQDQTAEQIDEILAAFQSRGEDWYAGEPVTQAQHALQAAMLAEQGGASESLIAAALLHDYGHLIHGLGENCADQGIDDRHEVSGANKLARLFAPAVTEPIRLHVPAKRYLCAVDRSYLQSLSDASSLSLKLQGGPFDDKERRQFESLDYFEDAVALRHIDDEAKIPDLSTPDLAHYRPLLIRLAESQNESSK